MGSAVTSLPSIAIQVRQLCLTFPSILVAHLSRFIIVPMIMAL